VTISTGASSAITGSYVHTRAIYNDKQRLVVVYHIFLNSGTIVKNGDMITENSRLKFRIFY